VATENDANAVVGGQHSSSSLFSAKSQVKVDTQSLTQMNDQFTTLLSTVKQLRREIPGLNNDVDALVKKIQSLGGGRGVSGKNDSVSSAANAMAAKTAGSGGGGASPTAQVVAATPAGGGGGGKFGKALGFLNGLGGASLLQQGMSSLDRRIDRGAQYSLSADRMTLLYQQMTGMSQQQVQATYRQPLTQYRLGSEGMAPLLGLQATTGINANLNAPGVQALRTISGFSLGSGDVANMLQSLGTPEVANRMFMMTGQSMYTFGGGQQSGMSVIQNLVQRMGLSDKNVIESGMRQGSVTRSRLRQAGVPEDMITTVLQYAQQNATFREKGGQGMYDPSNKGHSKLMGIEDNFAMQSEETERVKMEREENFYRRQADNFARLEKTTQSLEREFGKLEDRLSSIIGERVAGRNYQKLIGQGMQVLGGALSLTGKGAIIGVPLMFGGAALEGRKGDGSGTGSDDGSPRGAGASSITKAQSNTSFKKMHPKMQERIVKMLSDNPKLYFGNGWRDSKTQSEMFHSRYEKVESKEGADLEWNGAYWKRVRGVPAAPPGRSMHEIGLAADIHGDDTWLVANAERYGLKTFANVNNEPWHVQPAELPNGRGEYEKAGALWGTSETFPFVEGTALKTGESVDSQGHGGSGGSSVLAALMNYAGLPISEALEAFRADSVAGILGGLNKGASQTSSPSRTSRPMGSLDMRTDANGALTPEQVARIAWEAGFRGEDLVKMVAIAGRESRYRPGVHRTDNQAVANTENATGDFGLFQINYKNYNTVANALGLSSIHQLKDPLINAKAAFLLWANGAGASNWAVSENEEGNVTWDPNGDPLGKTNPVAARQAVTNAGLLDAGRSGDGSFDAGFSHQSTKPQGSTNMVVSGGDTYNISPVINVMGNGNGVDIEKIARELAQIIERDVRVNAMRRR
jgi:hypothetical protein